MKASPGAGTVRDTDGAAEVPREDRHPNGRRPCAGSVSAARRAVRRRRLARVNRLHFIKEMNRSMSTDSYVSLDAIVGIGDSDLMILQPYHLYIERTEASKNMARYYALEISATLFGEACLTRSWGRIGKRGQTKTHHFTSEQDAVLLFLELVRQKRARGYVASRFACQKQDGAN